MAASKSKNTGRSGKGTKNTRNAKKPTAMEQEVGKFQTEIIIFVILRDSDGKQFWRGRFCRRCDQ